MKYTRIVLKPQVAYQDVQTTSMDVPEWELTSVEYYKQDVPNTQWWKSLDESCVITYVQDPLREVRYYHLTGEGRKNFETILRGRMPTYNQGEVEALLTTALSPDEKIVAIYTAAASAPPNRDPAIFAFLTRSLKGPDPAIRRAAVDASLLALWPDLEGPLEQVEATDADADLRAFAGETLETLRSHVWTAPPGSFDFLPVHPNPRRITPLTGVRDDWYEEAFHARPEPPAPPVLSLKPIFSPPSWLLELIQQGDWAGFRWHSREQIQATARLTTTFKKPDLMTLSDIEVKRSESLWESMVPVADGPPFTARGGQLTRSRLFVNRDDTKELLLALAEDDPPIFWVPAGRTCAGVDALASSYFFRGIPPQSELPFQARLFLATQSMIGGFQDIKRYVELSPFTDFLPWGSSHPTDPYPERIVRRCLSLSESRRYKAEAATGLPRVGNRTRFSRSIIQLIDWQNAYFADLFFRSIPPQEWAQEHNTAFRTDFPPGTPVDVVGALSGLPCMGPDRIRPQAKETTKRAERKGLLQIIGFLEQAPSLD